MPYVEKSPSLCHSLGTNPVTPVLLGGMPDNPAAPLTPVTAEMAVDHRTAALLQSLEPPGCMMASMGRDQGVAERGLFAHAVAFIHGAPGQLSEHSCFWSQRWVGSQGRQPIPRCLDACGRAR